MGGLLLSGRRLLLESSFNVKAAGAILVAAALAALSTSPAAAQKRKNIPYADLPIVQPKPNKKDEMRSETLPPVKEPPAAVSAATARLRFETLPLSGKGLLSAQLREGMRALVRNPAGSVIKLRAFVAGSGDLRRVQEIAAEVFGERHLPMPALAVVQVGALPLEGAQVSMEATLEGRRDENPSGLAFVAAQAGESVPAALEQVGAVLRDAGAGPADVLRATCFVSVLDPSQPAPMLGPEHVAMIQMQREPARPTAACEAVARLERPASEPVQILRGESGVARAALVSAPRVVLSGIQLGFGKEDRDIDEALDHIERGLTAANAAWKQAVFIHAYTTTRSVAQPLDEALRRRIGEARPFTILPFEGLSSIDAVLGLDVIAAGN